LTDPKNNAIESNRDSVLREISMFLEDAERSKATGTYIVRLCMNCGGIRRYDIYGSGRRSDDKVYLVSHGKVIELEQV